MSTVGIAKADTRGESVKKSLDLVYNETRDAMKRKDSDTLFIKFHVNDGKNLHLSTHPDALKAVIEYFNNDFDNIIAGDTNLPFLQDNIYAGICEAYAVKMSDLRNYDSTPISFLWSDGSEKPARLSLLPESVFTVSLSLPKMHECLGFAGCSENMAGCVVKNKQAVHGVEWWSRFIRKRAAAGNRAMNTNIMRILEQAKPDISVMDFFPYEKCVALASDDCISIDSIASRMLNLPYVRYLSMAQTLGIGNERIDRIAIAKDGISSWGEIEFWAKPHYTYDSLLVSRHILPFDIRHPLYALARMHRLRDMRIERRLEKDIL